jgi:precorrin-6Y C5,15-methyltransferase (decarboxylating)
MNPAVRIAVNAITLQTLSQAIACFKKIGADDPEVICVNVAKSRKLGGYDIMAAQNPVYILTGAGGCGHV